MPRPKATKIKSTKQPLAKTAAQSEASVAPNEPIQHLRSPQIQSSSFGEDSDGLVTRTRHVSRRAARAARGSEEYTMTGALGFSDLKNAHHALDDQNEVIRNVRSELRLEDQKKASGRVGGLLRGKSTKQAATSGALSAPKKRRILIPAETEEEEPMVQANESLESNTNARDSSPQINPLPHDSRSQDQLVRNEETQLVEKVTDSYPSTQVDPPASHSKALATPSMVSISNFQRRPRQPSILRMVQQRLEEGDHNENDLDLELDGDSALLGPLISSSPPVPNRSSSIAVLSMDHPNTTSSKKRKLQAFEQADSSPLSSPPHPPSSQSKRSRLSSKLNDILHRDYGSDTSSSADAPAPRLADPRRLSSSPSVPLPRHLPRDRRVSGRTSTAKTDGKPIPTVEQATSPISSPPSSSIAVSPVKQKVKPPPKPKVLSTASLQAFLPRRRRVRRNARPDRSTFDILGSSETPSAEEDDADDSDADELGRRAKLRKKVKKLAPKKRAPTAKTPKRAAAAVSSGNASKKTPVKGGGGGGKAAPPTKTYGRRTSDKENPGLTQDGGADSEDEDEDENEVLSVHQTTPKARTTTKSKEMQAAAAKFAAVDEWELDFESQDVGHDGRGSSPWR